MWVVCYREPLYSFKAGAPLWVRTGGTDAGGQINAYVFSAVNPNTHKHPPKLLFHIYIESCNSSIPLYKENEFIMIAVISFSYQTSASTAS